MPAPGNDNQANATVLDSETGSLSSQTTVGSSGESSPSVTGSFTVTNGHDVWFKWRLGWVNTSPELPFRVWTEGANFRHVIRAYLRVSPSNSNFTLKISKGWFRQDKFDRRQIVEIPPNPGNWYNGNLADTLQNTFLYVQVDAADGTTDEGTFTLKWDRSGRNSLGPLGGHTPFQDAPGLTSVFKEIQEVTSASSQQQYWFNGGSSMPAGTYSVRYVDGYFQLDSGSASPSGESVAVFDTQVEILYNDSLSGHDGVTSFAALPTGYMGQMWRPDRPNWLDPFTTQVLGRFLPKSFFHTGGKIGLQFRNLYSGSWFFLHDQPNWLSITLDTLSDSGYGDNSVPENVKFGIWRHVPRLKFLPSSAAYSGTPASTSTWNCVAKNDTPLSLSTIDMYHKPSGSPADVNHNTVFAPHGTNSSIALSIDMSAMPVIKRVYFALADQPDLPEVYTDFDMTPILELYDKSYYGVVTSGGMQKWSCQVRFRNLCPYGYWLNHPTVTLVSGGTNVEYTSNQDMGRFQFNDGFINFKVRPPSGVGTVTFGFQVSDSGWTSPVMTATLSGTPV